MSIPKSKFVSKHIPPQELNQFMTTARERYDLAKAIDAEDRKLAQDDVEFCAALPRQDGSTNFGTTQWEEDAARKRVAAGRPCLTENRLPTFTAQVVNDGRQSKPAIKISPKDNGTTEDAEYFQGRIRQIEYDCQADIPYDTAREQQVVSGRGFLRVRWEYEPGTFRKRARIDPIRNQFSVLFGPCQEYDCSDAEYCFVISQFTRDEHKRKFGEKSTATHVDFADSSTNPAPGWIGVGTNCRMIQVAEYWVKEYKERTLCRLTDGNDYWEDELPDLTRLPGVEIETKEVRQDCTVWQYVIDGADIHDETEWIGGPTIPIVPVWGREMYVDGQCRHSSLIRYAITPQRLLNIYVSNIAEQIAQMPKSPYFVPVGGIPAGSEQVYAKLHNSPAPWVYYNQWTEDGKELRMPSRIANEPPIMALVAGYNQCVEAIKAAMGMYDAALGNRSNETAGIAIDARKRESDNANFHFHDNEARSRRTVGDILIVLISRLDQGKGTRAVRSEGGKTKMVKVGQPYKDEQTGKVIQHDLNPRNFGVSVETGPSYTSARKEAFQFDLAVAKLDPRFMLWCGDILFGNSDAPGHAEIQKRYEEMLPPNLKPQKPGTQGQISPQVAAIFKQMQEQAGSVVERLTEKVKELQSKVDSKDADIEARKYVAELQAQTQRLIAALQMGQKQAQTELTQTVGAIQHRLDLADAETDRQHQAALADLDRQHAAGQADLSRVHEADQNAAAQRPGAALPAQQVAAPPVESEPGAPPPTPESLAPATPQPAAPAAEPATETPGNQE